MYRTEDKDSDCHLFLSATNPAQLKLRQFHKHLPRFFISGGGWVILAIMEITKLKLLVIIYLLCALPVFANFQNQQKRSKVPRYSIIGKFMSDGSLNIDVFTSEKVVEENQLRALMQYFFKKYQKPENVFIYIYTHQSQLRDLGQIGVLEPNEEAKKHPSALLTRVDGKERISYTLPGFHRRTIIVKERHENRKQ